MRSRVEGQALREQALLIAPPKHLKRPLDIFRHMGSEFARYRKLVVTKYHDLALSEADVISCILKHLHDDCKRYLLLHGSLATLEQLERGLVFYDEQLRVLNFHKEAASAKGYPAFGGGKGDPKGKEKKGDPKGKHGGRDQKGDPKGKGKDKGNGKGGKKGDKHRRPSSAPPGKGGDKRKDGKCHYCGKPGHWARDCRKKAADEKAGLTAATAASASASASAASPSEGNVPKASAPSTKGAGKIGKAALLLSALSSPVAGETLSESNFRLAASNFPAILIFAACCMVGCLIFRAVMCQGNLRQSCFACFCVVAVFTWSRFAFASQPQSGLHQSVLQGPPLRCPYSEPNSFRGPPLGCPVLALPAVSMDDISYVLLDSGGSVHMLSESCLGVTAKLLKEFTVEPLEVSVANDEVLRITRYGLVELWLPSQQVDDAGRSQSEDIKVHFEAYLSPTSISILSTGTLQSLGFDLWHERYDPLLRLCYEFEGSTWHFDTELYSNTSWLRVCRYVEPDVGSVRASVGRLSTSHPEVGVGVGVGEVVGVGEPRTTRLNQDAAAALPQVCSEFFGAVRNHEWGGVGRSTGSSRGTRGAQFPGARGAQFPGARAAQFSGVLDGRAGRPCVSTATADTCAWRSNGPGRSSDPASSISKTPGLQRWASERLSLREQSAAGNAAQSGIPCSLVGPSSSTHHGDGGFRGRSLGNLEATAVSGLRGRSLGNMEATADSDLYGQFFNFATPGACCSAQGVYGDSTQGVYGDSTQGIYGGSTQGVYRAHGGFCGGSCGSPLRSRRAAARRDHAGQGDRFISDAAGSKGTSTGDLPNAAGYSSSPGRAGESCSYDASQGRSTGFGGSSSSRAGESSSYDTAQGRSEGIGSLGKFNGGSYNPSGGSRGSRGIAGGAGIRKSICPSVWDGTAVSGCGTRAANSTYDGARRGERGQSFSKGGEVRCEAPSRGFGAGTREVGCVGVTNGVTNGATNGIPHAIQRSGGRAVGLFGSRTGPGVHTASQCSEKYGNGKAVESSDGTTTSGTCTSSDKPTSTSSRSDPGVSRRSFSTVPAYASYTVPGSSGAPGSNDVHASCGASDADGAKAGPHDGQMDCSGHSGPHESAEGGSHKGAGSGSYRGAEAGSHDGAEGVCYIGADGGSYDGAAARSYDGAAALSYDSTAAFFNNDTAVYDYDRGASIFSKAGANTSPEYKLGARTLGIDDPSGTARGTERDADGGHGNCADAPVGCIGTTPFADHGATSTTRRSTYASGELGGDRSEDGALSEDGGCYQQGGFYGNDGELVLRRRSLRESCQEDGAKVSDQTEALLGQSACACVGGCLGSACLGQTEALLGQSACACVGRCLGSACLGVGDACACACVARSVGRSHGPSVFQSVAYPAEVRPSPSPMEQGWDDLRELFGDEGVDEVEGLAEAERVAEIERQRQPPDNINPTKDPEMIDSFPEDISAESKLRHQRQGHVPYWAECPSCVRARGLAPARSRSEVDPLECQLDQYFYRGIRLVAIVHVSTYCIGAAATYSGEARTTTVRNLVKFLRSFGLKHVHLVHDGEPLMSAIASEIVAITGGNSTSTKTSPSRHAPVAERAIRTLKEVASTNELHAKGVSGLKLLANDEAMELLHVHAASSHNRFASNTGNMLCPLQRALGESYTPHLLFPFACIIYIQPPEHLASQVDGRYDIGSYLGPVVGGFGHNVMLRLSNGSMKRCVAKALKMAYPVTYSSNLLPSLAEVNPDEPDYESLPGIALPRKAVPLPQPPVEWLEGNKTPRCPGCFGRSRFHSRKCKVRFRDYVRNTLGDLDNPEPQQQTPGKPRVHFDPQPEVVEFQEEAEYEPILPGAGEEAAPSPFDVSASPSPQEEFPLEYLPGGDVEMDQVDVEDYTVPMEMAVTPEALDVQRMLHHMYAVIPHQKHHLSPCEYDDVGLFASQLKRKTPAQHGNPDEGVVMPFGDREVWVIKPTSVVDDVSGLPLDPEKTWVGMQKEVAAMHSLGVGNVRSYQEIKAHCDETGAKIVKSRFVFTDKVDVDQQHIVRARLVAKDFAFNQPSALDLGIASQTASIEAFKAFICRVVQDTLVLWGLDVSTAILYAKLVLDTVLELPGCFQNLDGSKAYVILEKAIYGLRSAGLSWQKHLAGLLAELGLFPSLIEPTLYKGYWGDILVLCLVYVDDILLATRSKETNQQLLDFLTGRLKVKLTGRLEEDGKIGFLGREIIKRGHDILLAVKKEYVESIFEAFGWNREARKKMKACTVPPDLRSVLDKEDPAKPSEELSPEAASRYRSTLGKLGSTV